MNAQKLRKLLEQTNDKLSVFVSDETEYEMRLSELLTLIDNFLSDDEKLKLFDYPRFMQFDDFVRSKIIGLVSDETIIMQMITNDNIVNEIRTHKIVDIMKKMGDSSKLQLLHSQDFIEKHKIEDLYLNDIILSLNEHSRTEILSDTDLIKNKLKLSEYYISGLIAKLSDDDAKERLIEAYEFNDFHKVEIINSYSNENKIKKILNSTDMSSRNIIDILKTLDVETLIKFLVEQKEFCNEKEILPYKIICGLEPEKQKEFVVNLENTNLTLNEKRQILVTLKPETKQEIDTSNLPKEYKSALSMQAKEFGLGVIVDFERDLEDYRGLDNLMKVNPEKFTEDERAKLIKLCEICPNMKVENNLNSLSSNSSRGMPVYSTISEYKEAEEWIDSVIASLKPEYSKAQKVAIIDNAIGKKISYSPDFDTEVFDSGDCRALWKIVSSGYGVCNGIAKLEHYMLHRAGIESEMISGERHAFLKLKDIELSLATGETVRGNTILDPTWNLTDHRFGAKPNNFCISYDKARQNDIDSEGKDHNCHKNDEELQDATVSLDEQSLRQLFTSVGLADKEGNFSIKYLLGKAEQIDKDYAVSPEENIKNKFLLLKEVCPEFATCQNSSMSIVRWNLLDSPNLNFDKCVVNRVYDKADKDKRPVMYVYITSEELGRKFYVASKEEGAFVQLTEAEFVEQFECYENDLEKSNGIRPWESKEQEKEDINLATSSGKEVASKSEEKEI